MTRWPAVVALALAATSCGVPADDAPRHVADGTVAPPTASAKVRPPAVVTVYLLRGRAVVPVRRVVAAPPTETARLAALGAGPSDREEAAGLRTAIRRDEVAASVRDGVATVTVPASFATGSVLAVAQVVLTLTESPAVTAVRFVAGGRAVAVPAPSGRVAEVRRATYVSLLA